jgi:NAD(P)H dehydrogenase (quinone)
MKVLALLLLALASPSPGSDPVRILVAYHSQSGNTEKMARAVAEGAASVADTSAVLKTVDKVTQQDLEQADGLALGSPVHMGDVAVPLREAAIRWSGEFGFWESRGLQNKVGAVFATGAFPSNGKEVTMISLAQTLLQFGMVLVSPYGSVGASATTYKPDEGVDEQELDIARGLGRRLAETARRMRE